MVHVQLPWCCPPVWQATSECQNLVLNKMVVIVQTTFSNVFFFMKRCISMETAFKFVPYGSTDSWRSLVQVPSRRQAIRVYLNEWWPRSVTQYRMTMPQWVNGLSLTARDMKPLLLKLINLNPSMNNLVQLGMIACCLTAPSYYLNQCWLLELMRIYGIHMWAISQRMPES